MPSVTGVHLELTVGRYLHSLTKGEPYLKTKLAPLRGMWCVSRHAQIYGVHQSALCHGYTQQNTSGPMHDQLLPRVLSVELTNLSRGLHTVEARVVDASR